MPRVKAGIVELEYEQFGDPRDPALILVMGTLSSAVTGAIGGLAGKIFGGGRHRVPLGG